MTAQVTTPPATADGRAAQLDLVAAVERDRAAIVAMAGTFRVTFDFQETAALTIGYQLRPAKHEEAIELVEVIESSPRKIVLQHLLVIGAPRRDAATPDSGAAVSSPRTPVVIKHWRQDWTYEDQEMLEFAGNNAWRAQKLDPMAVRGAWTQAVYEVDDGPRYESIGRWMHIGTTSVWESEPTWRPLPRREYTTRNDYQVLVGRNRHTVTPAGWLHEQQNSKVVLDHAEQPTAILAREAGLNRYEKTDAFDISAGKAYWQANAAYWQVVRGAWDAAFHQGDRWIIATDRAGKPRFDELFEREKAVHAGQALPSERDMQSVIASYIK